MLSKKTSIKKKIMTRILMVYLCVLLVTVILLCTVFLPYVYNEGAEEAENRLSYIKNEYENMIANVENELDALASMPEFGELLRDYEEGRTEELSARLRLYLSLYKSLDDNVMLIMLEDRDGGTIGSIYHGWGALREFIAQNPGYQRIRTVNSSYRSPIYPDIIEDRSFCFCSKTAKIGNSAYIITACYNTDPFTRNVGLVWADALDMFQMENTRQERIYSVASSEKIVQRVETIRQQGNDKRVYKSLRGLYLVDTMVNTGGRIFGYVSVETLLANHATLLLVVFCLIIVPPLVLYISMNSVSKQNLKSVSQLSREIKDFRIGDSLPQVIKSNDEAEELSIVFCDMAAKVNQQAQNLIEQERKNADTMYKLLVTQLDPHFVSNTMNIINIMARNGRTQDIVAVNNALLRILRERLNVNASVYTTVQNEVQMLKQYILIVEYKYNAKIDISYEINHSVEEALIPKSILQLLVENALVHGLMGEEDGISGSIYVAIYPEDENLIMEVNDDGKGIAAEKLEYMIARNFNISNVQEDSHIGLNNIYGRLQYLYSGNFEMKIFSHEGEGTSVVISVPRMM